MGKMREGRNTGARCIQADDRVLVMGKGRASRRLNQNQLRLKKLLGTYDLEIQIKAIE